MNLYEEDNGKIKVYSFVPKINEIIQYKKEEMKNIPDEEQVWKGVTRVGHYGYPIFEKHEDEIDTFIFPMNDVNGTFHKLLNEENAYERNCCLEQYYNGDYIEGRIAKVRDLNKIKYFLLREIAYKRVLYDKEVIARIIQIPESLYFLHLIETGKFSLFGDCDVSEQLNLFDLSFDHEIDIDVIKKMNNNEMAPDCLSRVFKKVENDKEILTRKRIK